MKRIITQDKQTGFTLIELMITLALAAIILTMGIPSFSTMIMNNRLTAQTNQFVTAMNFARSEAIKRRTTMSVNATAGGGAGDEWGPGWSVVDGGGTTLRVFPALEGSSTLDADADVAAFTYQPSGRSNAGTLTMCDDRSGETGRQISVAAPGRVSTSTVACP